MGICFVFCCRFLLVFLALFFSTERKIVGCCFGFVVVYFCFVCVCLFVWFGLVPPLLFGKEEEKKTKKQQHTIAKRLVGHKW